MVQMHASERRRYPRVPFSSPIEYQSALGLETALACDLSGGGMRLTGHTALPLGSDVWLKFKPPTTLRPMFLQGRVVRLGPPTTNVGEHDGFAIGFVDPAGSNVEELDRSVRRYLAESGVVLDAPSPPVSGPVPCHVAYRSERDFVDAYTQHLCGGYIEVRSAEPLATGAELELELELPNYYEILRLAARVESELGASGAERLYRARILEPGGEAMRFVHGFASVFLGAREARRPKSAEPAPVSRPSPVATPAAEAAAAPSPAPATAAPVAAPAAAAAAATEGDTDLAALVAEALSALDEHAVAEWKSPRSLLGPEEAAAQPATTLETQRIENIAEVVAETFRARPTPERVAGTASAPPEAGRLKVSGKSAAEWALALADVDPDLRAAAASALGKLGSTAAFAVASLADALGDRDPRVRRAAAWALGDVGVGAAEAVPALIDALSDGDGRVRWRAVRALRAIGPAAALAVPELSRALTDEDDRVRQWAATALADLAGIAADGEASFSDLSV